MIHADLLEVFQQLAGQGQRLGQGPQAIALAGLQAGQAGLHPLQGISTEPH
jgi:hypothetical protein